MMDPMSDPMTEADRRRLERFTRDLETLVNIDSATANPDGVAEVAAFLEARLAALGMDTAVTRQGPDRTPCLRACTPNRGGRWDLLFLGHMDTVFEPGEAARRPFARQGSRALGPGANDMKGGLLLAVNVLETLKEQGHLERMAVCVAFNGDEETGSVNSRQWIEDTAARCDRVFVFEACRPGFRHVLERKGSARITVTAFGRSCHSGTVPQTGINAVVELAHQIGRIHALSDGGDGVTAQCTMVRGGHSPNIVPDRAEVTVDLRYATMAEMERAEAFFEALPDNTLLDGARLEVAYGPRRPPMECSAQSRELWGLLREACLGLGVDPDTVCSGGCTDGNWTAAMGIPTVDGVGPVGANSHRLDEYLDLDSVIASIEMVAETCRRAVLGD